MNPAQLLAHFDRVAEAPDALPRLRRFILDLAVRGKLVEQDPKDEPASRLLQRLLAQKETLVKAGKIKRPPPTKAGADPQGLLDLPSGWVFTTIQDLCSSVADGDHQPPPKSDAGVPFLVIVTSAAVLSTSPVAAMFPKPISNLSMLPDDPPRVTSSIRWSVRMASRF